MIYADTKRDVCPFCGGKLHQDPHFGFYQCDSCMTQIKENTCTETKRKYYYTDNAHLKKYAISRSDFKKDDDWSYDKQVESQMYFRNITKINHQGDIICPICNKVHEDKSKSHM
jgi:ribosomal protein L37AE/L43A